MKGLIPSYWSPSFQLDNHFTGVNFASGGSGYDPLSAKIQVNTYAFHFCDFSHFVHFIYEDKINLLYTLNNFSCVLLLWNEVGDTII